MLTLKDLKVAYGPIEVLHGISLEVPRGGIVSLIGANGAGKTTILNTISGLLIPASGTVSFEDRDITGYKPDQVIRMGIAQVPEGRKVFTNLTVYECLLMGGLVRRDKKQVQKDIETVYEMFPRLKERRRQLAGTLSGGEQEMLAFGRALVAKPRLLLLDEPSMGLAPKMITEVAQFILMVRDQGMTVLLVEQNSELALTISDYGYVLETGSIIMSDKACNLINNQEVRKAYMGL
ncbi:MAG: ABC transporter ATP-binding protein [Desulfotignum sp.]|nr:ABC transporter ATP-binding protein [Desulfotignum sp.]MCF8086993.1 ABC transporter ATP-binding protein [Desulfotignum sp.]MCF8137167.1 ABC transporter ATP-binding protein [Desulfotignum sp.]